MRKIAIINQKGGVGKTTTAVNLGAGLAAAGRRVLLIDLDPQAHATLHLGISDEGSQGSIYDVLVSGASLESVACRVDESLTVVPSHIDLAAAEVELAGVVGREMILREKLAEFEDHFDYVLVDCPPSLGVLTLNALTAMQEAMIPLQAHFLSLHGLSKLLETIALVADRLNPQLTISAIVFCMYDSMTRLASEVRENVEEFFRQGTSGSSPWAAARTCTTPIRRNVRLAEAPSFGQSIFQYASTSHGADDYRQLASEVIQMEEDLAAGSPELDSLKPAVAAR
jgi:chromosome partitioning protein